MYVWNKVLGFLFKFKSKLEKKQKLPEALNLISNFKDPKFYAAELSWNMFQMWLFLNHFWTLADLKWKQTQFHYKIQPDERKRPIFALIFSQSFTSYFRPTEAAVLDVGPHVLWS